MPVAQLKEFLDKNEVKYKSISHSKAFTAMETAAAAHVRGRELAKSVVLKVDGRLALAVMPSTVKVDWERLRRAIGATNLALATEQEFRDEFPGCELGAEPPFGNLFHMDVYVDHRLAEDEDIAFNAGTHSELVRMPYRDFERLARPIVVTL